jgi:hypothetical protein
MKTQVPDHTFDEVSRGLAAGISRRNALKMVMGGVTATTLADVEVASAKKECACGGTPLAPGQRCCTWTAKGRTGPTKHAKAYNPIAECCTDTGLQPQAPIKDLEACKPETRVQLPGGPTTNCGCDKSPDNFGPTCDTLPASTCSTFSCSSGVRSRTQAKCADFLSCCVEHDCCYATCGSKPKRCNDRLSACLVNECYRAFSRDYFDRRCITPGPAFPSSNCLTVCIATVNEFVALARATAWIFHSSGQREHCACCSTKPPCCDKNREMCGEFCCERGEKCVGGECCPPRRECGSKCCQRGERCEPGVGCVPKSPPPVIPEVPTTVLLPLSGLAAIVAYLFRRRSRAATGEATGEGDSEPGDSA